MKYPSQRIPLIEYSFKFIGSFALPEAGCLSQQLFFKNSLKNFTSPLSLYPKTLTSISLQRNNGSSLVPYMGIYNFYLSIVYSKYFPVNNGNGDSYLGLGTILSIDD